MNNQKIFHTAIEFNQASFVNVARHFYEQAVNSISGGVAADVSQEILWQILEESKTRQHDKMTLNALAFYYNTVLEENQEILSHKI